MTATADVAVVGLGGIGSAAAAWCARRGASVVGFEQFDIGHDRGASEDHSRIIRRSYHTSHYVELAAGAYHAWADIEDATGTDVVVRTGGVDLFPPGAAIDPGPYRAAMDTAGVPYEVLGGPAVRDRWPRLAVADDVTGLYQADTGIADPYAGNAAHRALARGHGATLIERTPVRALRPGEGGVALDTDDATWWAGTVVVAADAWTAGLLAPLGVDLPLVVLREQVTYFTSPVLAELGPGRFPVWIWMDDPSYYGFCVHGPAALKFAEDCGGVEVDPDTRTFDPDSEREQRLRRFAEGLLAPGTIDGVLRTKTCLYTLTPDRDFVLDRVPGAPGVVVALGAAHGYKFAAWFGRTLAEMALDGSTPADITPFRLDRPGLAADAPRTWMV